MWSFWALTLLKFIQHDVQLDSKTCWEQHIFNKLWQQQVTGKVLKCSNIPEDSTGWEATSDSVMAPFERSVVVWTTCSQASVGRSSPLWLFLKANVFIVNSWRIEVVVGGHQAKKVLFSLFLLLHSAEHSYGSSIDLSKENDKSEYKCIWSQWLHNQRDTRDLMICRILLHIIGQKQTNVFIT